MHKSWSWWCPSLCSEGWHYYGEGALERAAKAALRHWKARHFEDATPDECMHETGPVLYCPKLDMTVTLASYLVLLEGT